MNATGAAKINFERHLNFLPDFNLVTLRGLDDEGFNPCDLLVISALSVPSEKFLEWLEGINRRIVAQNKIWTPAIIVTQSNFSDLNFAIHELADNNWYFDIVNPDHLDSIPIRAANLLKIHDHLHELLRYKSQLDALHQQVSEIEEKLMNLSTKGS